MTSSRKNKILFIDKEAVNALEMLKDRLLYPAVSLMNKKQCEEVIKTGLINGKTFPFPFILAPSGKKNREVLESLKTGEKLTLMHDDKEFAILTVDEVFHIDPKDRLKHIYGTDEIIHPDIDVTLSRIGSLAVSGEYELIQESKNKNKQIIQDAKKAINAKHTTGLVMAANPLHRAHEKLIRQTLETTDLLVIFLIKPHDEKYIDYEIRKKSLEYFINNFLVTNHTVIVPLENSYIFAGYNELIIDAIVTKNYGCDKLTIGKNHSGLGMFYDANSDKSIMDKIVGIDIDINISNEYVYCDECVTLVSKDICPHGQHHHISYHSDSILELLESGILPPAVLVRKEISTFLLSRLHPNRLKNLEKLYCELLPIEGLLKEHTEEDFYLELMKLYQTTSLT